jgi:hypothetical protein
MPSAHSGVLRTEPFGLSATRACRYRGAGSANMQELQCGLPSMMRAVLRDNFLPQRTQSGLMTARISRCFGVSVSSLPNAAAIWSSAPARASSLFICPPRLRAGLDTGSPDFGVPACSIPLAYSRYAIQGTRSLVSIHDAATHACASMKNELMQTPRRPGELPHSR